MGKSGNRIRLVDVEGFIMFYDSFKVTELEATHIAREELYRASMFFGKNRPMENFPEKYFSNDVKPVAKQYPVSNNVLVHKYWAAIGKTTSEDKDWICDESRIKDLHAKPEEYMSDNDYETLFDQLFM